MKYVYSLSHEYETVEGEEIIDILTDIAVYSSRDKAEKALEKFKVHPKFKNHPDGFVISRYVINKREWQEGFVTY